MMSVTSCSTVRSLARTALFAFGVSLLSTAAWAQSTPFGFASVGFGVQSATKSFTDTFTETVNVETATYGTTFGKKGGNIIDASVGIRLVQQLYVGVAFTQTSHSADAAVTASVPHPFFFNRNREASGTAAGAKRNETGTHIQATWRMPVTSAIDVSVFGGASILQVEQTFVDKVIVNQAFPFDTISFQSATVAQKSGNGVGGHVGGDVTYRLAQRIGVGAQVRFVTATAKINVATNRSVDVDAGGVSVTGGVRVFF
jgi:hypothetical protein